MFIWDFVASIVLDEIIDWLYGQAVGFLGIFFSLIGNMGAELFEMSWVAGIVQFFSSLAWTLYLVGLVVAVFETAMEYQTGRGSIRDTGINFIKGFLAASLFSVVPVELYKLSISMQISVSNALTGLGTPIGDVLSGMMDGLKDGFNAGILGGVNPMITNPIFMFFIIIMMGYAVIKVFFANLKRGGILLIQIAVGSLYLFGVPRGYIDGFMQWSKQIIGLCLTAFLQSTILTAGLMVLKDNALLGLGLMLSAGEVPRIAGAFGLDTSAKANLMGAVHTAQAAINTTKTVVAAVAK